MAGSRTGGIASRRRASRQRVAFRWVRDEPGEVELRARIEPIAGEALADDNSAAAKVRVDPPEIRVLLVAGHSFPEFQFLTNTLIRDKGIDAACFLQHAEAEYPQKGDKHLARLPETEEEMDLYDAVLLYDPDPADWPAKFPGLLQHLVGERGGGLVFICGETFTRGSSTGRRPGPRSFSICFPVVREPHLYVSAVEERLHAREPWRLDITEAGLAGGLFRFAEDPAESERIGRGLPGLYWHLPITREKPGAIVLARHGDPRMANAYGSHVVVASHLFGPGRSIFIACDSTYRWRFVSEQVFDGFWARVVDRAGRAKSLGGIQPLTITTDRKSYAPGPPVVIHARFSRPGDQPARLQALTGRSKARTASVPRSSSRLVAESRDAVRGHLPARAQRGPLRERLAVRRAPGPGEARDARISPSPSTTASSARPGQDRRLLNRIAAAGGGRVFDLDQVADVPSAFTLRRVAASRRSVTSSGMHRSRGPPVRSLFLEWILRKRHGLA